MRPANRLAREKSPYLLQHQHNPVDWYPWGEAAFEKARAEDRPIFLSIGYATCHWCHVMEHESFEAEDVAALLNAHFVSIKVDREERPDVDHYFMTVCQLMGGSCGWPLTVVMTPDKRPFFVATYIPRAPRFGRPGMLDLLPRIATLWRERRADVEASAHEISAAVERLAHPPPAPERMDADWLRVGYHQLLQRFDARHGGFGQAPKFPSPHTLLFLLRYWRRTGEPRALKMVTQTLEKMRLGGLFDHVGFGFHRYSTDARWLVPHFEKMLYDQALLLMAYVEAYQATKDEGFARTAREVAAYVLRDMTHPLGGFFSAEDADSEGEEGKFYVWTREELEAVLGDEEAAFVAELFQVEAEGNYEEEASRQRTGRNILHLARGLDEEAAHRGLAPDALRERWEAAREQLFAHRKTRVPPLRDDKVLTDWNGLMVAALARAGRVLGDERMIAAARQAVAFIREHLRTPDGRLWHRWRDGDAGIAGLADDYAFLTWGLLELYTSTFDVQYLSEALALTDTFHKHFWDEEAGGYFLTPDDAEDLPARQKPIHDGALPSANAVAMMNLLRLARLTGEGAYEDRAARLGAWAGQYLKRMPSAFTGFLMALDYAVGPAHEVVIVGEPGAEDTRRFLRALRGTYLPNTVVLLRPPGEAPELVRWAPFTASHRREDGKATAYVCRNYTCHRPTTDPAAMLATLLEPTATSSTGRWQV